MSQSNQSYQPPKWPVELLRLLCRHEIHEEMIGDLLEYYQEEAVGQSKWKANLRYCYHALHFLRPFALKKISKFQYNNMISNNIKIGFRHLLRHPGFSAIHIIGLVLGIVSSLFILSYINQESGVDQFHAHKDSVFRINTDLKDGNSLLPLSVSSGAMGPAMKEEFAEVTDFLRISRAWEPLLVKNNNTEYFEPDVLYTDNSFFAFFDFNLKLGSENKVFENPYQVVLSSKLATKYFGEMNPVGQLLTIKDRPYEVTGVLEDIPLNSHLNFEMLISFESWIAEFPNTETNWGWFPTTSYLLLNNKSSAVRVADKFPDFVKKYMSDGDEDPNASLSFTPLADLYFSPPRLGDLGTHGNKRQLLLLMGVAVLILILALSNFINLSSARASTRMKEVGVRKVLGAVRRELIQQFFVESILLTFFSTILAAAIFILLLPAFSRLIGQEILINSVLSIQNVIGLLVSGLLLGVLAGAYPALIISSFKPVSALKGIKLAVASSVNPRKVMTTFQFFISIGLLIVSVVMWQQFEMIRNRDLGFEKERTLVVNLDKGDNSFSEYKTLKTELSKSAFVQGVSFSSHVPGDSPHSLYTTVQINGESKSAEIALNLVDEDFISNYGLELLAGRAFSESVVADTAGSVILNEAALSVFGMNNPEEAIGLEVAQWGRNGKVIGVVKDFNNKSLHEGIEPLSFQFWPGQYNKVSLKLASGDLQTSLKEVSSEWTALTGAPFNYSFLDDRINNLYQKDQQFSSIFKVFTALSLAIAALGLVGLASFVARLKNKEVAIRKVLGARPLTLLISFMKEFGMPAVIALLLVAAPTYYFLNDWLNQFAYHVGFQLIYILLPLAVIFGLVFISVIYHTGQLIFQNPTNNLRDE